ncbi:MAG: SurA N-terminal domain-containing protein [Hyphomicrobium sp.]|nr:SurA N-terminal domain-containing protein [Hyphomicrobium sp.]
MNSARIQRDRRGVVKVASWMVAGAVMASAGMAFAQQTPSIPGLVVTTTPPAQPREPVAPLRTDPAPPKAAKPKPAPRPRREASTAPATSGEAGGGAPGRRQGIVILVNDEPITGYEIEQRATLMAAGAGGGQDMRARAEARWKQIIQDPKTNERFQQYLREKQPRSRDEAVALQKQYIGDMQRNMLEQLRREARVGSIQKFRTQAQEELIDEKLKIQEGKRNSIAISEDDVNRAFVDMAQRNKITEAQFTEQLKSQGIDPATIKARTRAALYWRDVVRRKYGHQININDRDIDRFVEQSGGDKGAPAVEMQLHKITLAVPGVIDQSALARRLSEAEQLRKRFRGCRNTQELVKGLPDARFESLANQAASSIGEPTRSLLLNAKDGEMVPPTLASTGVELYAVCGRKTVKVDEEKRLKAQAELTMREFDVVSRRHLRDLRAEALIEKR